MRLCIRFSLFNVLANRTRPDFSATLSNHLCYYCVRLSCPDSCSPTGGMKRPLCLPRQLMHMSGIIVMAIYHKRCGRNTGRNRYKHLITIDHEPSEMTFKRSSSLNYLDGTTIVQLSAVPTPSTPSTPLLHHPKKSVIHKSLLCPGHYFQNCDQEVILCSCK